MMNLQTVFYFGADCGLDPAVTDDDFAYFVSHGIVPFFAGFTLSESRGFWEGKPELVRVLTIIHESHDSDRCTKIAETYRDRFSQSAVLVTTQEIVSRLV